MMIKVTEHCFCGVRAAVHTECLRCDCVCICFRNQLIGYYAFLWCYSLCTVAKICALLHFVVPITQSENKRQNKSDVAFAFAQHHNDFMWTFMLIQFLFTYHRKSLLVGQRDGQNPSGQLERLRCS